MQRRPQIFLVYFESEVALADGKNLQGILEKGMLMPGGNLFPKM